MVSLAISWGWGGGAGERLGWGRPRQRTAAMLRLPARFAAVILCFAPLFRHRSWRHAQVLLIGAILAPGRRTVTSILRITGLCRERRFVNYHRVLNRAAWSGREAARILLSLLLDAVVPSGPVLLGLDDTIERRRGKRISAKGIYRDPVRSSHGHFVKASGLRWLSLMLLVVGPLCGPTSMGRAGLGVAVPDHPCPLGAVLPRAGDATNGSPIGGGNWSCRPVAGCRAGRWCW